MYVIIMEGLTGIFLQTVILYYGYKYGLYFFGFVETTFSFF